MSYDCDPCNCSEMYYRSKLPWRKAMLVLLCRIRTVLDNAIIEEESDALPAGDTGGAGNGGGDGPEPSPQGD